MGVLKEFKDFALKGNVVDLAVAVIIGGAFGVIISSLVDDVITPLLLTPALKAANAENLDQLSWGAVKYGKFLAAVIKFIIIAFILFLLVKGGCSATSTAFRRYFIVAGDQGCFKEINNHIYLIFDPCSRKNNPGTGF